MSSHQQQQQQHNTRLALDRLFATDSAISVAFGSATLLAPHVFIAQLAAATGYNHSVHETLRLYACLRLACGWILWHIRRVDDGLFRRHVCEALLVCYVLQALVVLRAQFTDRHLLINWIAIAVLIVLAGFYASFRFGKGGNLIKIYELPTAATLR